jgi:CBS domain-containing protein
LCGSRTGGVSTQGDCCGYRATGRVVASHGCALLLRCSVLPICSGKQKIIRGKWSSLVSVETRPQNAMQQGRLPMTVNDILSQKGNQVLTIEPAATLATAVQLLAQRRIGALVVTGADSRIVGIISERDIVRVLDQKGTAVLGAPVAEAMTRKVVTCALNETIAEIMERMTGGKFRHVPVVEQGRLVGIVSIGDVVKARLSELEQEQDALRDYIRTA